jgi:hypothetical protein
MPGRNAMTSGAAFYDYFKGNCPNCPKAHAHAYNESSGADLWTYGADAQCDYTLTFCP